MTDDTASMIKGGGYVDARTRQPPTVLTHEIPSMGQGFCVPWHPDPHLDCCCSSCIAVQSCFYECRCMSDGVLIQFVCQLFVKSYGNPG